MKPPRIVYLLVALCCSAVISILCGLRGDTGVGHGKLVPLAAISALALYFSYFAVKRFKYDFLKTNPVKKVTTVVELNQLAAVQLCQIEATNAVKIKIKLICKECHADESFPLQILDREGSVLLEEMFVPAFGNFHLETDFRKETLPLRILITNPSKTNRQIRASFQYAEIV